MDQKKAYEEANMDIICLEPKDVIATSTLGDGGFDKDGWA